MATQLEPADIVLVHGKGWISRLIRAAERDPGEAKSWASHVALAVGDSYIAEAIPPRVVSREMPYAPRRVQVYRPRNLSEIERRRIARFALDEVGRPYGVGKVILHGLDSILGDVYLFRRFAMLDGFPICSWLVAAAYEREGYTFGEAAGKASPDSIYDFVTSRPDRYERVG